MRDLQELVTRPHPPHEGGLELKSKEKQNLAFKKQEAKRLMCDRGIDRCGAASIFL